MTFRSPAPQFDAAVLDVSKMVHRDFVAYAKAEHAKVMGAPPKPLNFLRHVDGREAPEEAVKPGGIIVYDYNRLDLIAKNALDLLRKESPVKSGRYVSSHQLYLNLQPVDDLRNWKMGDEVSITNTVPYSRVIEVGKRGGTTIKFSRPPHIYERVARALIRDYKQVADIQFTYRAVLGGAQVDVMKTSAAPIKRGAKGRFVARGGVQSHNKSDVRYPTITINPSTR